MKLKDVCIDIWDCPHTTANDEGEGYPLIRTPNIGKGRFILSGVHRVCEDVYNIRNKRAVPQDNDLIFAREAPAGNVAIIKNGQKFCLGQRTVLIRPDKDKVNPDFLTYFLLAPKQQHSLLKTANGSTSSHVNMKTIRDLQIDLPARDFQDKAALILCDYDELIELNQRRISILEEMSMRTYREWFVYFRFPEHESCEFESGLPKGWKFAPISDLIENYIGGGWGEESQSRDFSVGGYVIRGSDIPDVLNGIPNKGVFRYHKSSNIASRELSEGDIIFEISGGSDNQPLGRNCLITKTLLEAYGDKVICASFCKRLIPQREYSEYLFGYLHQLWRVGALDAYSVRITGISNFKFEAFLKYHNLLIPPKEIVSKYSEIVKPIYNNICMIGDSIDKLQQMRDRLLPQLMSGKLVI